MKIKEYSESRKQSQDNVRQVVYRMKKDPEWSPYIVSGGPHEGYDLLPEAVAELDRQYLKSVKMSVSEYNDLVDEINSLREENNRLTKQNSELTEELLQERKPKSLFQRIFGS